MAAQSSGPGGRAQSALVVDDSAVDRKMAEQVLERAGLSVTTAGGGDECLSVLSSSVFDVILMDVNMPGMDGFELLQAIKARPHLRGIPIVMMSSDSEEQRIVRSIELGAADFVLKPLSPPILRSRIASALQANARNRAATNAAQDGHHAAHGSLVPASSSELLRILAVDDSVATLRVLQRSLTKRGYNVTLADSGEEAIRILTEVSGGSHDLHARSPSAQHGLAFDVILLDIIMPGMTGQDVIRRLKSGPPAWSGIPIIIMSSLDDPQTANDCLALGADDVITKPFNADIVVTRINACTERLRLRSWVLSKLSTLSASDFLTPGVLRSDSGDSADVSPLRRSLDAAQARSVISHRDARVSAPVVSPPGSDHVNLAYGQTDAGVGFPTPSATVTPSIPALPPPPPRPGMATMGYESEIDKLLRGASAGASAVPSVSSNVPTITTIAASTQVPDGPGATPRSLVLPSTSSRDGASRSSSNVDSLVASLRRRVAELEIERDQAEARAQAEAAETRVRLEEQVADMQRTIRALTQENRQLKKQATTLYDHEQQLLSTLKLARVRVRELYEEAEAHGYVPKFYRPNPLNFSPGPATFSSSGALTLELALEPHEEPVLFKAITLFENVGAAQGPRSPRPPMQLIAHVASQERGPESGGVLGHRRTTVFTRPLPAGRLWHPSPDFTALVADVCGFPGYFADLLYARLHEFAQASGHRGDAVCMEDFLRFWTYPQHGSQLPSLAPLHDRVSRFWRLVRHPSREFVRPDDLLPLVASLVRFHPDLQHLQHQPAANAAYQLVVIISLFCSLHGQRSMRISYPELRGSNLVDAFYLVATQTSRHVLPFSIAYYEDVLAQWRRLQTVEVQAGEPASVHTHYVQAPRENPAIGSELPVWMEDIVRAFGLASVAQVAAWADPGLNPFVLDRIMRCVPRPLHSGVPGCIDFVDFMWLLLALRDRMADSSLAYWFRALDADDDGVLSVADLRLAYDLKEAELARRASVAAPSSARAPEGTSAAPAPISVRDESEKARSAARQRRRLSGNGTPPVAPREHAGVVGAQRIVIPPPDESSPTIMSPPLGAALVESDPSSAPWESLRPALTTSSAQAEDAAHEHTPGSPRPYDPELDDACKPLSSLATASLNENLAASPLEAPVATVRRPSEPHAAVRSPPSAPLPSRAHAPAFPEHPALEVAIGESDHKLVLANSAADNALSSLLDFISPARPGRVTPLDIKRTGAGPAIFDVLIALGSSASRSVAQ